MATLRYWDVTANAYLPIPALNAPPSGPAGGDLFGTYPNPGVHMGLPPALGSTAPLTTFTDSLGQIWVAKGGVHGGAWAYARDVLHMRYAVNNAFNTLGTTALTISWDTAFRDPYGINTTALPTTSFTIPLAGLWRFRFSSTVTASANGQWNTAYIQVGGATFVQSAGFASTSGALVAIAEATRMSAVGDIIGGVIQTAAVLPGAVGAAQFFMELDYVGTG